MTVIYTMTFGSFIGFSAALPLSIKVIFGFQHMAGPDGVLTHTLANPNAPSALTYAWIGPFIGAVIRPVGGWLADKLGGALVTQICSIVLWLRALLGAAHYMQAAYASATPEIFFTPFFLTFMTLFFWRRGSATARPSAPLRLSLTASRRARFLGWTSAVAAYGAFIIPDCLRRAD
jgi:NNP family nitrate/nitrite transporter-like MFS transporter